MLCLSRSRFWEMHFFMILKIGTSLISVHLKLKKKESIHLDLDHVEAAKAERPRPPSSSSFLEYRGVPRPSERYHLHSFPQVCLRKSSWLYSKFLLRWLNLLSYLHRKVHSPCGGNSFQPGALSFGSTFSPPQQTGTQFTLWSPFPFSPRSRSRPWDTSAPPFEGARVHEPGDAFLSLSTVKHGLWLGSANAHLHHQGILRAPNWTPSAPYQHKPDEVLRPLF